MALVSHHQLKEMGHDPGYYPVSADGEAPDLCGPILDAAQRMQDGRVVPIIEETPGGAPLSA
jgi:hypothetical protein